MTSHCAVLTCVLLCAVVSFAQQPGPNVNVLPAFPATNAQILSQPPGTPPLIPPAYTLTDFLRGDGYQQRQVEPSIAASSYNPDHIVAVYGDYRTVALPESTTGTVTSTGWMGISRTYDRGQTWFGGLIPGFPQDTSSVGRSSPLYGLNAGSDATITTTPGGHFYIGGLFWTVGGISNVAVIHYRDVPDTEGGDTIRYQGAAIVDKGSMSESGNFTDKPSIAADIARGTTNPSTCGPVYIAYTIFTGGTTSTPFTSKLGFTRSRQGRCGTGWDNAQYLNKSYKQNQGAAVAVDPNNGKVYVVWRHVFQAGGDGYPDSILIAVSSDGGNSFTSPVPITPSGWSPYDQLPVNTTNTSDPADDLTFRSNAFPTIAVDGNSNVYVAAQEKALGNNGYYEPRIVIRSKKAASNTFTPLGSLISPAMRGAAQQVMPELSFGAGSLKALWYDFRDQNELSTNVSGNWFISGVDRQVKTYVAQVDVTNSANFDQNGNPVFGNPVVVTQYLQDPYSGQIAKVPGTEVPAVNRPNVPMYVNGTTSFEGDYIGLQAARQFVPNPGGTSAFRWATQPSDFAASSAYAAWTDSRDVVFPSASAGTPNLFDFSGFGWSYYAPPGTGNSCYNQGSRNANVYFSEIKPGVIAGSPSLNRQLVSSAGKPIERDFPLYLQNPNPTIKYFVLSFASGPNIPVDGSFEQGKEMTNQVTTTDVTVLPLSTVTATLYAYCPSCNSSSPFAPFSVSVTETDSNFNAISNPIQSQIAFDNDPSAPLVNNIDTELHDVTVSNAQFSNPQYATPQYATPQYATAQFSNPQYATPQYATTGLSGDSTPVGDFIWTVRDVGNTASAYLSLTNVAIQSLGSGYTYQVIISRAYNFPYGNNCNSQSIPTDQIISVISNPQYATPQYATPQYATPQYATAQYGDATFSAFPVTNAGSDNTIKMPRQTDFVYIVLRVYRSSGGTTPLSAIEITNFLNNISQTVYPQAAPVSATRGTTTVSLGSSANPSVQGSPVTFTATLTLISNPANATPTGTVTFYDGATQLGTGNVTSNTATFSTSVLTPGLHTIVAKYAGDTNFLPSTTALGQTVLAVSQITLVSSQNPSVYGQSVNFTATIVADFTHFTPTGTVTFYVDGVAVDSGQVDPTSHQITYSTSGLSVGSHQIYVSYAGDNNFHGCTSTAITQTVNQGATSTGLLVTPQNPLVGQTLTLLATVLPVSPSSGMPTGTVTFKATMNVGGGMGTTTLGTVQLDNAGHAQKSVSTGGSSGLTAGLWTFEADYNGDGNFTTSVGTQQVLIAGATGTLLFDNWNTAAVSQQAGGPPTPTTFGRGATTEITQIATYHYNNGNGATPGTISLVNATTNQTYGPFTAVGYPGQNGPNEAWVAAVNVIVPSGTYRVTDSDPATWSYNSTSQNAFGTGNAGFARVWGFNSTVSSLVFTVEPGNATANSAISPAVSVQAFDSSHTALPGIPITLALSTGPGMLNGTLTQITDATGTAVFRDISVDTIATGDLLQASAGGATVTSTGFNILAPVCTVTPPGLLSWYPFDGNALDIRGGRPGTILGNTGGQNQFVAARVGQGFKPTSSGVVITAPNGSYLDPVNFTASAWIRVDAINNSPTMLVAWQGDDIGTDLSSPWSLGVVGGAGFGSGSPGATQVGTPAAGKAFAIISDGVKELDVFSNTVLQTGFFYYVTLTWGGPNVGASLYVNGVLQNSGTGPTGLAAPQNSFQIGGILNGPDAFNGVIDELQVWGNVLTPFQIASIYDAGQTGQCQDIWWTETGLSPNTNNIGSIAPDGTNATEYTPPETSNLPLGIVAGPDGNIWFTDNTLNEILVFAPLVGGFKFYQPTYDPSFGTSSQFGAWGITSGPDGNLWFTEANSPEDVSFVGNITTGGTITTFQTGFTVGAHGITAGPDGNLWFAGRSKNAILQILAASPNTVTTYPIPTANSGAESVAVGPDGNLWFTELIANKIGVISTSGAILNEFPIPGVITTVAANGSGSGYSIGDILTVVQAGASGGTVQVTGIDVNGAVTNAVLQTAGTGYTSATGLSTTGGHGTNATINITVNIGPWGITAGPDGALWFTENNIGKIGRVTPNGTFTSFTVPGSAAIPQYITAGPDGNLWFTDNGQNTIDRMTPAGAFTAFPTPSTNSGPWGIAIGPAALPVPAAPTNVVATNSAGAGTVPTVSWTASTSAGVISYNVYRATTSGGPYVWVGNTTSTTFTDLKACGTNTFYYVVTAVGVSNVESVNSNETSGVVVTGPC